MIKKVLAVALIATSLISTSCKKTEMEMEVKNNLTLDVKGLDPLGSDFVYEGWIIVDGKPISTGTFSDVMFPKSFTVDVNSLKMATKFVVTIEPKNDTDPKPSATKILAGAFNGGTAAIETGIVGDFSKSTGAYILATPTNGGNTDENSGIWFLKPPLPPVAGLEKLPELKGWKYEGWVVINGTPVSTGKFDMAAQSDEFDGFSSTMPLPNVNGNDGFFPGEDFLVNAPAGMTFPLDLSGAKAVITVEPNPDNSPMPFTFKPLVGAIPTGAMDHHIYNMNYNPIKVTGSAKR